MTTSKDPDAMTAPGSEKRQPGRHTAHVESSRSTASTARGKRCLMLTEVGTCGNHGGETAAVRFAWVTA